MPTIPKVTDYGARPSLRSSRVDIPGAGDTGTGEALAKAADAFATIYGQQKTKDDRLNYSLAKNELLTADITEREKLREDEDYATYDERYSTGYNVARDEIYGRYPDISPADAKLLDSESDLIRERGRVQIGERARVVKIDNERGTIEENLVIAREQVQNESRAVANEVMLAQLENIKAGEENGIYKPAQALNLSQKFVSDTAHASLTGMDVEDRIEEIELTLAKRKAHGPIDIEDIRAGKGSGSIGDFLNKDVLVEMLRKAKAEHKQSSINSDVFAIVDQVTAALPETDARSLASRKKMAREMLDKGDPDYGTKRATLERVLGQRNNEDVAIKNLGVHEISQNLMDQIRDGKGFDELWEGDIQELSPQQQKFIKDFADNWQDNEGFADATNPDMAYAWSNFTPTQMVNAQINGAEWRTQFTRDDWNRMIEVQKAYRDSPGKDPNIFSGDSADAVLKNMLITGKRAVFDEVPKPGSDDYERYLRIDKAVNDAITDASLAQWRETGSGKMLPQQIREITAQTVGQMVFIDDAFWNTEMHHAGLTEAERRSGDIYVDIDEIRAKRAPADAQGTPQNMEQFIRNMAGARGEGLSDRKIEKAYFFWIEGNQAEFEAILTE